jgi:uncharacterized repeat protein (TIGR01451 family)
MKRWMLRLSALSGVVVLGLIAIAQAQRSTGPSESSDQVAPSASRDPFASRPDRTAPIPLQNAEESNRYGAGSTAKIISVEDRPAKRTNEIMRTGGEPTDAAADRATGSNDPFNLRERAAAAPPERFRGDNTAAELPRDAAPAADPRSVQAAQPGDNGSIFSTGNRYANPAREVVRSNAEPPAQAFDDRDARPLNAGPSLGPANGAAPVRAQQIEAANSARSESDFSTHGSSNAFENGSGTHSAPYAGTTSVMKHGTPGNALRPVGIDATMADTAATSEGTGRPGTRQLEGAQSPQLTIEKSAPAEVQVGKTAKFEIKVRNAGSVAAQGVEIHDEVPKGTKLVSTTPAATPGPRGELVWSLGTINPGDQVVAQLELMPVAEGEIGSVASVTFRADASARTIATRPQLILQVSAPKQVMIGSDATLTIRLSNPGTGAANGVVIAEKVPAGLKHPAGGELEFEVGTLKPGQSRQIDLTLKAAQAGRVVNTLTARGEGNLKAEERAEFDVIAPALAVAMTGPSRRYLERQATYTVSVSNPGSAPAKDVQLVTQLPKGLKFVKANNSGQYDPNTNSVTWSLEELPAAETGSVTLVALPVEVGEQRMKVQGKAQQGLSDEQDHTVLVEGLAALALDVQVSDEAIEIGGETTYQIHVVNQGSKAASNVQIAAIFPPELKATHAEGPSREAVEEHRVQFEPLARLAPKSDATFRIRAQAIAAGDLRVKVQLMTDEMRQPVTREESTRVYTDQ